jgi:hypothetical protein
MPIGLPPSRTAGWLLGASRRSDALLLPDSRHRGSVSSRAAPPGPQPPARPLFRLPSAAAADPSVCGRSCSVDVSTHRHDRRVCPNTAQLDAGLRGSRRDRSPIRGAANPTCRPAPGGNLRSGALVTPGHQWGVICAGQPPCARGGPQRVAGADWGPPSDNPGAATGGSSAATREPSCADTDATGAGVLECLRRRL